MSELLLPSRLENLESAPSREQRTRCRRRRRLEKAKLNNVASSAIQEDTLELALLLA